MRYNDDKCHQEEYRCGTKSLKARKGRMNDGFESQEAVTESQERISENEIKSKMESKIVNENDYDETADKGDNVKYIMY